MTKIDTSTEAVERLMDGVTPGPWRDSKSYRGIVSDSPSGYDDAESVHAYGGHMVCESVMDHNRPFIAAARQLVPALLKERDEARAALAASQPADPVTNAGCRHRSIEGVHQMTRPTDEELDALVEQQTRAANKRDEFEALMNADRTVRAITALRAQVAAANARADRAEAALAALIEAAIREIWGLCEDLEDEAYAKLKLKLTEHEQGFWAAQKMTAKRIRRATQMPANDRTALDRMLAAAPAAVAPSLRITGPNSDGEYWLHINAGGRSGGVNLGGERGPICKQLLDAASETGAKE